MFNAPIFNPSPTFRVPPPSDINNPETEVHVFVSDGKDKSVILIKRGLTYAIRFDRPKPVNWEVYRILPTSGNITELAKRLGLSNTSVNTLGRELLRRHLLCVQDLVKTLNYQGT